MSWKGKKVLVTGAGGFIGGSIARSLLRMGAQVTCLFRHQTTEDYIKFRVNVQPKMDGAIFWDGDVSDYKLLCEIISTGEIEYVFHLAANAIVRVAAKDPMSTYQANVMGTVALLEACRNVGRVKKIVVASSDKAYGDHLKLPYNETMALQPKNTYDTSKACADMIARTYAANYGMPICVTRCSNVYGPGDENMSRIIPNSITRILRRERPQLYSDVAEMEREFVYIDDVVDAFLLLGESGDHTNGQAFNVGRNEAYAVSAVVEQISKMMTGDCKVEIIPRDPVFKEIQRQCIDPKLLECATGWKAKMDLQSGLRETIEWYRDRLI